MEDGQREVFRSLTKTLCLLAVGALWAICLRLVLTLPDALAITVLVIVVLVCLLILVVT